MTTQSETPKVECPCGRTTDRDTAEAAGWWLEGLEWACPNWPACVVHERTGDER